MATIHLQPETLGAREAAPGSPTSRLIRATLNGTLMGAALVMGFAVIVPFVEQGQISHGEPGDARDFALSLLAAITLLGELLRRLAATEWLRRVFEAFSQTLTEAAVMGAAMLVVQIAWALLAVGVPAFPGSLLECSLLGGGCAVMVALGLGLDALRLRRHDAREQDVVEPG